MGKLLKGLDKVLDPAAQLFGGGKEGKISAALDPGNFRDKITGKSEREAGKKKAEAATDAAQIIREQTEKAREGIFKLFPAAQQDLRGGFQGALDIFGQSLPAQTNVFQQGNVAAQQQLLAGLPQFQNAIFGNQVDFGALQPTQIQTPDLGFFQQQLPQFVDPFTASQNTQTDNPAFQVPQTGGFVGPTLGGNNNFFNTGR